MIILPIITFLSLKITKILLYHEYGVKKFGTFNNDVVIIFHGIYGEYKDMEVIDKTLEKEGYSGINIQYPTTEDTVEEISEKYIAPNVENILKTVEEDNKKDGSRDFPKKRCIL